eukprot:TRINITY_DN1081_c1_g2_i1.p1 TRINITY_DN1081_c1_g2~~TRINITY_DN1081_c1_g2_i1.p1  ORF type:complete len:888 (-),score=128.34 TRINITY_DN1081_c1_g2_i1:150-2813(-)
MDQPPTSLATVTQGCLDSVREGTGVSRVAVGCREAKDVYVASYGSTADVTETQCCAQALEDWVSSHGGRLPRMGGREERERILGTFLKRQLQAKALGTLVDEDWNVLAKIPGVTERFETFVNPPSFEEHVENLKTWVDKHKRLPKHLGAACGETRMASFLHNQRVFYMQGLLPKKRMSLLKEIVGMPKRLQQWDTRKKSFLVGGRPRSCPWTFQANVEALAAWLAKRRCCPIKNRRTLFPRRRSLGLERRMHSFLNEQRKAFLGKTMSEQRRQQLSQLPGMTRRFELWENPFQRRFDSFVDAMKQWVAEHNGRLPRHYGGPTKREAPERRLAKFLANLRQAHRAGRLDDVRRAKLEQVPGMTARLQRWDRPRSFEDQICSLASWMLCNQERVPNRRSGNAEEKRLAVFLDWHQRLRMKGRLSTDRRKRILQVLGEGCSHPICVAFQNPSKRRRLELEAPESLQQPLSIVPAPPAKLSEGEEAGGHSTVATTESIPPILKRRPACSQGVLKRRPACSQGISKGLSKQSNQLGAPMQEISTVAFQNPSKCRRLELEAPESLQQPLSIVPAPPAKLSEGEEAGGHSTVATTESIPPILKRRPACSQGVLKRRPACSQGVLKRRPACSQGISKGLSKQSNQLGAPMQEISTVASFKALVRQLAAWVHAHGVLPKQIGRRAGKEMEQQRLARFLNEQQQAFAHGALHEERRQLLLEIPGMHTRFAQWEFSSRADKKFETWVSELKAWVGEHGRLPEHAKGSSAERRLGHFLNLQRRHVETTSAEGQERLMILEASGIPGMTERIERWRHPRCSFDVRVAELDAWVRNGGGSLPKRGSSDLQERRLANFVRKQRDVLLAGSMVDGNQLKLASVPGMAAKLKSWAKSPVWQDLD